MDIKKERRRFLGPEFLFFYIYGGHYATDDVIVLTWIFFECTGYKWSPNKFLNFYVL